MNPDVRKSAVVAGSVIAVVVATVGVYRAIHSPLFTVQVVEVTDQVSDQVSGTQSAPIFAPWTPVDPQTITDLAAVPVGQANLFDLDLRGVERRILTNEWVREVKLQKKFPQTLSITTIFRAPKALVQLATGGLAYLDEDGKVFGKVSLAGPRDLPLISGVDIENTAQLKGLLKLISSWNSSPVSKSAQIDSLTFDIERGYRLMISYGMDTQRVHARLDLGRETPEDFTRLAQVISYLESHSITARQIFADAGKKIVVKTAHGS